MDEKKRAGAVRDAIQHSNYVQLFQSAQLAQIELAYAELELMQLGLQPPELRRSLAHIVSARTLLRRLTADVGWTENSATGEADSAAPAEPADVDAKTG